MNTQLSLTITAALCAFGVLSSATQSHGQQPARATVPPTSVDLRVEDQPLLVLLERIARQCERGLVVHREAMEKTNVEVRIFAKDAPWEEAMRLLRREYGIELQLGPKRIVVIDADAEFRRSLVRRYYPTRALTESPRDHIGPTLGTWSEFDMGSGAGVLDLGEELPQLFDDVFDIMRNFVGPPESWDRDGVMLQEDGELLIVRNVPAQQQRVRELLEELERSASRQVVCRLYAVPESDTTLLQADAWRELSKGLRPLASFVIRDGARNYHWQGVERMMTLDMETVGAVHDPVRDAVRTGLVLDVTSHVTQRGILANVSLANAVLAVTVPSEIRTTTGESLGRIDRIKVVGNSCSDQRFIPNGGAALYRLGSETLAVSLEVVEAP